LRIRFVNHASFICEHAGVRLICDPWLYGSAFNDGWDLIAPTRLRIGELAELDYIWFSHEHPDHFSVRTLLDIPRDERARITILYRETTDKKVVSFCAKHGFAIRELAHGRRVRLAPGFEVVCQRVPLNDSWLLIDTGSARLLNLNDAMVHSRRDLARLREQLGPIDLLTTQFSYAAWRGNASDSHMRRKDAQRKLDIIRAQVRELAPRFVMPFASFCWFSSEENDFTNDSINTPAEAVQAVRDAGSIPVLMYPGDEWQLGSTHDNAAALERWAVDYAGLPQRPRRRAPPVAFATLHESAITYAKRIRAANDPRVLWLLRRNPVLAALRPIDIHLWDLDIDVRFSFERGLERIATRNPNYDLRMGSASLQYLLDQPWGIDTLTVNARFHADPGGMRRLVTTFGVDLLNNAGIRLSPAFLIDVPNIAFLLEVLLRKLWSMRDQTPSRAPTQGREG
jgi:UDP-MurNAc hydroxylase